MHLSRSFQQVNKIFLILIILLYASNLKAESEFRLDLAFGGIWHDAEKSTTNRNDDWLCWASSAANVLAWTKWGTRSGFSTEDEIFSYFTQHWTDHPAGSPREAWRWWFTGKNLDFDGRQFFLEFRSETRCAGLVPSGCAILNLHFHRPDPFSSG